MKIVWQVFVCWGLAVALSGCALGTRSIKLAYTPVIAPGAANGMSICVRTFQDQRPKQGTVGCSRNGWGMCVGDVVSQNNVADWVTEALALELKNAGYSVSCDEPVENILNGTIFEVVCDAFANYDGSVGVKVTLAKNGENLIEKNYTAKRSGGLNWGATPKTFAYTLDITLQDVMRQVVLDVNRKLGVAQ